MAKMPRERCPSLGLDALNSDTGAEKSMEVLQKNLAPDASDAALRDIITFFGEHRPHLTLDEYLSRFEMARRRAEARLPDNGIFPDIMLSSLRLRHAGVTPNRKSRIPSRAGGDPSLETTKRHVRRIFTPCGVGLKRDVLTAEGDLLDTRESPSQPLANKTSGDETRFGDAHVVSKKTKQKKRKGKNGPSPAPLGNGDVPNRINSRAGYRNRCYGCGSEFYLLAQRPGKQPNAARRVSIAIETPDQDGKDAVGGGVYTTSIG